MSEQQGLGFNLQLPLDFPSPEEVEALRDAPKEEFLQKLLDVGYITLEELAAYYRFTYHVSGVTPYLLDGFLASYREAKEQHSKEFQSSILT